jgi:hypothetical protein
MELHVQGLDVEAKRKSLNELDYIPNTLNSTGKETIGLKRHLLVDAALKH